MITGGVSETAPRAPKTDPGLGYVDLWLIHWPPGGRARPDVWARLLELQAEGLAEVRECALTRQG